MAGQVLAEPHMHLEIHTKIYIHVVTGSFIVLGGYFDFVGLSQTRIHYAMMSLLRIPPPPQKKKKKKKKIILLLDIPKTCSV